jgi:flagellar biosynthesis protein FliQ
MSLGAAIQIIREGVWQTLIMAGPLLLIGMAVGLVIAILQATTSIQEQTLSFVPKIAAILLGLALLGTWMLTSMIQYTKRLFEMISNL